RPPEDIRSKLDIGYVYDGKVVEFYEIRPDWMDASIIRNNPFAKIRYVKSKNVWNLYWKRANGKWEVYEPFPHASNLQSLLDCIEQDKHGCFYG
ncbi:MAG: DUF3024 domain-containing protein, partial [Saprospiraceae bacterium]|nr:DUF3024 domain-containing protein [Saprospiraceae bacterium]